MNSCTTRSSAAIVQQVPTEVEAAFRSWQLGVTEAARSFPGFEGTDVYPPATGQSNEWVTVIHFESESELLGWLNSTERALWVARLRESIGDFEIKRQAGGFSFWFDGVKRDARRSIPSWKMALTVLLGLYPTVLLLTLVVGPITSPLGFALSMLIGNALSVALLQWAIVPCLVRILQPWLNSNTKAGRLPSIAGAATIVLLLIGLALLVMVLSGASGN